MKFRIGRAVHAAPLVADQLRDVLNPRLASVMTYRRPSRLPSAGITGHAAHHHLFLRIAGLPNRGNA